MLAVIEIEFYNHCPMVVAFDSNQYSEEEINGYIDNYDWEIPSLNKKKEDVIIMNKEDFKIFHKLLHNNFELVPKNT